MQVQKQWMAERSLGQWVETGSELTWLPLQHVLGLHPGDVGDGGEDVSAVGRRPLQAVAMVDLTLASLLVDVELQHTKTHTHTPVITT